MRPLVIHIIEIQFHLFLIENKLNLKLGNSISTAHILWVIYNCDRLFCSLVEGLIVGRVKKELPLIFRMICTAVTRRTALN